MESGKIWLTDIFGLNDPSELSHGLSHLEQLVATKAKGTPSLTVTARAFADTFLEFRRRGLRATAHYFTVSLSSAGDELGQWRAYADNGRGYALGFNAKVLEGAFAQARGGSKSSFPVIYDDARLIGIQRQLVDLAFSRFANVSPTLPVRKRMIELSSAFTVQALQAIMLFKHEAYRNEQEYRLLQVFRADRPTPGVLFRARPYTLVRYREFDWRSVVPLSLERIVIGPAADREKAMTFAQDCLREFHKGSVEIEFSTVPYRVM